VPVAHCLALRSIWVLTDRAGLSLDKMTSHLGLFERVVESDSQDGEQDGERSEA